MRTIVENPSYIIQLVSRIIVQSYIIILCTIVIVIVGWSFRRRSGVLAKRGRPLHRAAVAGRAPRGAVHAAGLLVPGVVPEPREPDVRQQPGRVPGPVAVPPRQRVVAGQRRVHAAQPGHLAAVVVRVAAPQPVVHHGSARLQAAGAEQGGPRLPAVPRQTISPAVRRTYTLYIYTRYTITQHSQQR